MKETPSYEENIKALEELIRRLEQGDLTLEAGLCSFEAGVALIKKCQLQLERAANRIQLLTQDGTLQELAGTSGEEKN